MTKKKIISLILCVVLVLSVMPIVSLNIMAVDSTGTLGVDPIGSFQLGENVIPQISSTFEGASTISDTAWKSAAGSPSASLKTENSNTYLRMTSILNAYSSYGINILDYISAPDTYFITFDYKAVGQGSAVPFCATIRSDKAYSFIENTGANFYSTGIVADEGNDGVWHTLIYKLTVTQADIDAAKSTNGSYWKLCFHQINSGVSEIGIDNFKVRGRNILPLAKSTYETATSVTDTGWIKYLGSSTITLNLKEEDGNKYFSFDKANDNSGNCAWYTAGFKLSNYITTPDTYTVSFDYRTNGALGQVPFAFAIRGDSSCSFNNASSYFSNGSVSARTEGWQSYSISFTITESDIQNLGSNHWAMCFHGIKSDVTTIDIDNLKVVGTASEINKVTKAQTWVANEAVFVSSNEYADPYNDVTLDIVLTNTSNSTTLTVPCFWDGGKVWRGRFACPTAGTWTYTTVCSDTTDTGLHGQTSTFYCSTYNGDLDIYKKGFVKTVSGTRYFKYNNGDAFFYLGDTHWSLGDETVSMVETIAEQRKAQGYTVIQSEPLGARFNFVDGITGGDIAGFAVYDQKFKIIADNGLVHANAEFFFPSMMRQFVLNNGGWSTTKVVGQTAASDGSINVYDMTDSAKAALRTASRYWVARYGAYPVMWTLGQEVDNDFYWERGEHSEWNYVNNPYLYVAECIAEFDVYSHPLTGHMEGVSRTNLTGVTSSLTDSDQSKASAFTNCTAHTWYAAQWSQGYNKQINFVYAQDFWDNNTKNKPVVNYEGKYCYLWTKDFGARVQGWMSYLCGMYGCSFGGQDTWSYKNTYNEEETSSDGVDIITSDDKKIATWQDSLEYISSYQLGYMRDFFEDIVGDWYNLVPRFANNVSGKSYQYFTPANSNVFYVCASSNDAKKAVVYFYNTSDTTLCKNPNATDANAVLTGTLAGLSANTTYNYVWYNPVTGQIDSTGTINSNSYGKITVPNKAKTDMVFYVCKANSSCTHSHTTNVEATTKACNTRAYAAYTICRDCLKITAGTSPNAASSTLAAHTSSGIATCVNEEKCTVCNTVLTSRLGHDYSATVNASSCEEDGSIDYLCKRDGCNATKSTVLEALGHADFECAKYDLPSSGAYFWITQYGSGNITPFKGIDFTGDSCTIQLYVYNGTTKNIVQFALAYNWGYHSYASDADTKTQIAGTKVNTTIAPGSSKIVTITVPKSAIISNKEGYATDNSSDSVGKQIPYNDMGIRIMLQHNAGVKDATGSIYIACVGASDNVTNWQSITQFYQQSGSLSNGYAPTAVSGFDALSSAVRTTIKSDYQTNGYITTSVQGRTFTSNGYVATHCIRCDEVVDKEEIGGVVNNSTTVKFTSNINNASVSYSDGTITATTTGINRTMNAGQVYTLTANAVNGKEFAGWYRVSGTKKTLLSKNNTVNTVINFDDELYAYYIDRTTDYSVVFKDNYGNTLSSCTLTDLSIASIPAVSAFNGTSFVGWKVNGVTYSDNASLISAIQGFGTDAVVSQVIEQISSFKVNVSGSVKGSYSQTVSCLSVFTVEAPETSNSQSFSYWEATDKDGNVYVASNNRKFSFYVTSDTTLAAVYGQTAEKALITVTEVTSSDGKAVATIQRSVAKDCTVVEQGVILTKDNSVTENDMVLGASGNVTVVRSSGTLNNGVLIVTKLNVAPTDNYRFRGYVIYKDSNGNTYTKYSAIK